MGDFYLEKVDLKVRNESFLSTHGNQLLTVGAKHLRLFRTNPYTLIPPRDASEEWKQKTKLECVYSCRFMSPIQSFAKAKLPGSSTCFLSLPGEDDVLV
ncbi:hypothetical protein ANCCAN_03996 [Ancylostoma caninum]|uniref:Uncharacterized protein n=1 Tax=Ancylostoma caninum TaxID=29170 RepID=A0A368H3X6_ANCCA|nr:hypothetical protein ANCCAN_03996 [Ancylostoma caninum]